MCISTSFRKKKLHINILARFFNCTKILVLLSCAHFFSCARFYRDHRITSAARAPSRSTQRVIGTSIYNFCFEK